MIAQDSHQPDSVPLRTGEAPGTDTGRLRQNPSRKIHQLGADRTFTAKFHRSGTDRGQPGGFRPGAGRYDGRRLHRAPEVLEVPGKGEQVEDLPAIVEIRNIVSSHSREKGGPAAKPGRIADTGHGRHYQCSPVNSVRAGAGGRTVQVVFHLDVVGQVAFYAPGSALDPGEDL